MVLVGDFDLFEKDQDKLKQRLREYRHLELQNYPAEQTTL